MAENPPAASHDPAMSTTPNASPTPTQKAKQSAHQIYTRPAPIRTFPLPTFIPNNPISLIHIAYAWISQSLWPPPPEPAVVHEGTWSEATCSVHVTVETSVRALWEQGFYGKGNLSRSEPNWLNREMVRRGLQETHVSEILTAQRREERLRAKWERARLEQELIRQTREAEILSQNNARRSNPVSGNRLQASLQAQPLPPVGPAEILSLPNSEAELRRLSQTDASIDGEYVSDSPSDIFSLGDHGTNGNGSQTPNGSAKVPSTPGVSVIPGLHKLKEQKKEQKSVRFSPTIESATFKVSDPPSPDLSNGSARQKKPNGLVANGGAPSEPVTIVNKEHLQLMPEEALWLSFGLGVLKVNDAGTGRQLTCRELLTLFRQYCYFPPRTGPDDPDLQPDDDFLIHYAVYHHFRSLGWVPRGGTKFGVDWLLYTRGPVFDHAEFGLVVMPSYTDPYWETSGKKGPPKTWSGLHRVIRVLTQVLKSMVLVYVDVPPPSKFEDALEHGGFAEALKLYRVREIMVKRWSSNRNR